MLRIIWFSLTQTKKKKKNHRLLFTVVHIPLRTWYNNKSLPLRCAFKPQYKAFSALHGDQWGFSLKSLSLFSFFHYPSIEIFPTQRVISDIPSDSFYVNIYLPLTVNMKSLGFLRKVHLSLYAPHQENTIMTKTYALLLFSNRFNVHIYSRNPLNTPRCFEYVCNYPPLSIR